MCRETIRKAVTEKFKSNFPNCQDIVAFDDLKDKIDHTNKTQRFEANKLINDIKIVDPAVGSGHFLVSALNEMIAIKSDLQILSYANDDRVKGYTITLDNDELIIQNQETDKIFEYTLNQNNNVIPHLQELQECLFLEKQKIIENCLFGVDINPKSVMICQLRLWIELLKNAYYTKESNHKELQTLPNIDINIKTGNSLISKFNIKDAVLERIPKYEQKLKDYKNWVYFYKETNDKATKNVLKKQINAFKDEFKLVDNRLVKLQNDLQKLSNNHYDKYIATKVFSTNLTNEELFWKQKLENDIADKQAEIQTTKDNPIYENAFEWRFEFPEVLDDNGNFVGFDVVIGNPPYVDAKKLAAISNILKEKYKVYYSSSDLSSYFFELAFNLLSDNGLLSYINTNKFFKTEYGKPLRNFILNYNVQSIINFEQVPIFDEALVSSLILVSQKNLNKSDFYVSEFFKEEIILKDFRFEIETRKKIIDVADFNEEPWNFSNQLTTKIFKKLYTNSIKIKDIPTLDIKRGVTTGYDPAFIIDNEVAEKLNNKEIVKPLLKGRDLKKYQTLFSDKHLIFTRRGFNIDKDLNLKEYLNQFYLKLKPKSSNDIEGRKPGEYKWFEIQDNIAYYKNFDKDKIVWPLTADKWGFALDTEKHYLTSCGFMMVSTEMPLHYVLGVLNSNLMNFLFSQIGVMTAGGAYTLKKATIDEFPLKLISIETQQPIISLVDQILTLKKEYPKADTSDLEKDIDKLVYQLYELTNEEIAVIEKA
jgi:adenine-specific DNA-methyltransferase